eukprot:TRINITY_DN10850_c0_g1_i1.p1 TRINITY_DN10850_c0_g1~~TRINITY_DN10850_c0_g1_i1.p1  ORF type:complete len:146 (-),score=33.46 TRINITY_DN10850_c0_g1_i1:93-530(-)
MSELREAFELFDTDKDGVVSREEVLQVFDKLGNGISPEILESYIKFASKDENTGMNFEKFQELWKCLQCPEPLMSEIRQSFNEMDTDSDGFISTEEMLKVVDGFSHVLSERLELAKECIKDIDIDKDGKVSFTEFLICWKYKAGP